MSVAGLTEPGIEGIHAAAERHVGDNKVPGLVALVARGDQVHVEALGTLAVAGAPVARDSIFRIASTTKPITGAATMALRLVYDDGSFGWDGGFGSSWLVDPARDLTVIVLTQRMWQTGDPPDVHREITDAAYAALA